MLSIEQKSRVEPTHGCYAPSSLISIIFFINKQNQTLAILNKVFSLAGFEFALLPKDKMLIKDVVSEGFD